MVVGVRHIHSILYPFVVFPALKLAQLVLGSGIRACSGLPQKKTCRRTGKVTRLCGKSLGRTAGRITGAVFVLGKFLFQGFSQSNQNLVLIGTLLVRINGRLVFGVQVNHVGDEVTGVESGEFLHPLAALALGVCEEIHGCLAHIVEGYGRLLGILLVWSLQVLHLL